MKEMNTTGDIFYPGNLVTDGCGLVVEVVGHMFNSVLPHAFSGIVYTSTNPIIKGNMFLLIEKRLFKQYKSPEMELKITKEKVLEAASKCSTAKETLKTLFPDVFEEESKKEKEEIDRQIWDQIANKLAHFTSSLVDIKPLTSYEYRFLRDKLGNTSISGLIIDLLKNHNKAEPVEPIDYSKLIKLKDFTVDFNPTKAIFIDNGASGNINFHGKVFILNPDWNWSIMKARDGNTSFRDILVPTIK